MKRIVAALALSLISAHAAFAQPVAGSTSGVWVSPNPSAAPIVTTGVGTSAFTWGEGAPPNTLTFAGGLFGGVLETPFKVGTITYFNGSTTLGTTPDSINLSLTLNFGTPALPSVVSSYLFTLNTTPNTDDPVASADFVDLPSAFSTTDFLIGSTTYRVKLTGFQNIVGDGFLASSPLQFHVEEGQTASADLYAEVTTQTAAVPEPETYALMLAGLAAVGSIARRRRKVAI